jgi:hypothetical protein
MQCRTESHKCRPRRIRNEDIAELMAERELSAEGGVNRERGKLGADT